MGGEKKEEHKVQSDDLVPSCREGGREREKKEVDPKFPPPLVYTQYEPLIFFFPLPGITNQRGIIEM